VCQRLGAHHDETPGFDVYLLLRLARRPIWVAGLASMIAGFALQVSARHFRPLALVQPILAVELIFVFAYIAAASSRNVKLRDWLAALAMCAGLGLFLLAASPSGGRPHAPAQLWWLAALACLAAVTAALINAFGLDRHTGGHPPVGPPR
jgi:drug/metabolite transporter (DMT)-like permease